VYHAGGSRKSPGNLKPLIRAVAGRDERFKLNGKGIEMTPSEKDRIDNMDYESMLRLWRNAPVGHPMFSGDTGQYYSKVMAEKRDSVGPGAHVAASKNIGWEGH